MAEQNGPKNSAQVSPEEASGVEDIDMVAGAAADTGEASEELLQSDTQIISDLEARLVESELALKEAKDQALRSFADAQNVRRRAEMDVEKAHRFALEKFVGELLPVVDNLERAMETADPSEALVKPLLEGIDMNHKLFLSVLKKFDVERVDPLGAPFDPQLHQAMSMVEKPDAEPNTVIHVMQKGYSLNGRLVRPAMVVVAKAAPQAEPPPAKIDEKA